MTMASKPLCFFWHLDVPLTLNFSRFSFYFRHCISINLRTGVVHCMFIYMLCLGRKVHFRAKCWTLLRKENANNVDDGLFPFNNDVCELQNKPTD